MARNNINKEKSELIIIATAALHGPMEDQEKFNFDATASETKIPGGIGYPGTKYVTTTYEGVEGNIELTGAKDGKETLLALSQHVDPANYVGFHLGMCKPIFILARGKDDNDQLVSSYFVEEAKLTREPTQLEQGNITFPFTAPQGMEFAKDIAMDTFDGDSTPLTSLTLNNTAIEDPTGRNVMLVLKDTAAQKGIVLKEGKDYTATTTAVTLTNGLETDEKALVVYLKE